MTVIKVYLTGLIILSVAFSSCHQEPERKNVLFILADDYGYNDMSYRNSEFYETPSY